VLILNFQYKHSFNFASETNHLNVSQVRIACIFGNLGNEALLVTNDDKVFGLGSNGAGCLGYGDMQSTLYPRKVDALCNKVADQKL
jgi:hypothetical protein